MGEVRRVAAVGANDHPFERLLFFRCLKAYEFAKPFVMGKSVLEIGCGTGYGLDHFAQVYAQYVGLDIDSQLLTGLAGRYSPVSFLCADVNQSPLCDHSFDVIVAFQVIEHLSDPPVFFQEARRLLRTGGHLLLTTPNRAIRLLPFQKPWNPEHVREYSYRAFRRLMQKHFQPVALFSLCGDPLSFELERRRVKQNPYQVYVRRPLGSIARRVLPGHVRTARRSSTLRPVAVNAAGSSFPEPRDVGITLNNFSISEGYSPRCLDFLAVVTI